MSIIEVSYSVRLQGMCTGCDLSHYTDSSAYLAQNQIKPNKNVFCLLGENHLALE